MGKGFGLYVLLPSWWTMARPMGLHLWGIKKSLPSFLTWTCPGPVPRGHSGGQREGQASVSLTTFPWVILGFITDWEPLAETMGKKGWTSQRGTQRARRRLVPTGSLHFIRRRRLRQICLLAWITPDWPEINQKREGRNAFDLSFITCFSSFIIFLLWYWSDKSF